MFFARRKAILSVVALGLFAMSTVPAAAATTRAHRMTGDFAIQCSGDVCMQTASKNATYATIHAWANNKTFYGHFQLWNRGCGNTVANSPDETWPAGGIALRC